MGNFDDFLAIASNEAKKSVMYHQYGAVVVYRTKIIGIGYNKRYPDYNIHHKNYAHNKAGKYSIHAEVAAISSVQNKNLLKNSILIVVRIESDGSMTKSQPCENCKRTILENKLKKVYFLE